MKRVLLFGCVVGAVVLGWAVPAFAHAGVPLGTPVQLRTSPDNAIVTTVQAAAGDVGLGAVTVVNFQPDCSPIAGQVVVCRNPQLHKKGARAVTLAGDDQCVVRLDPSVGGAGHGVNVLTKAFKKCLESPA